MRKIFSTFLTFLSRFIVVLLAAITVFATIFVLLLTSFDHTLLQAETYKRALAEHKVYEQLPTLVSDRLPTVRTWLADPCTEYPLACAIQRASPAAQTCLTKSLDPVILEDVGSAKRKPTEAESLIAQACIDQYDGSKRTSNSPELSDSQLALLKDLTSAQWEALITHLLPPADTKKMIETALDQIIAYYKGEAATAQMPLASLKARLTGKSGGELTTLLLKSQAPCTAAQVTQINASDFGNNTTAAPIYCAAEGDTLSKLTTQLQTRLDEAASQIPEAVILIQPLPDSDPLPGLGLLGKTPQTVQKKIYTGIRFSPLLVLLLLLLVAVFGVRSLRGWLRWWSIPIFLGGLIAVGFGIASLLRFEWAWAKYVLPELSTAAGSPLSQMEHQLVHTLVTDFAKWVLLEAGVVTLLALGVLLASSRVKPPPDPSLPPLALPGTPGGPVLPPRLSKRKGKSK